MERHNRIKELREKKGVTLREVATSIGVSYTTIQKYESGAISNIKYDTIIALANYYHVHPTYLMGWSDTDEYTYSGDDLYDVETQTIPLLGKVACGEPIFMEEMRESYVRYGTKINADFCLICVGDSMIGARIYDGDIVFARSQPTVENGEIAVVAINDEATLKRVYFYADKGILQLSPENPKYAPIIKQGEEINDVHILGKAIAFQSDVE